MACSLQTHWKWRKWESFCWHFQINANCILTLILLKYVLNTTMTSNTFIVVVYSTYNLPIKRLLSFCEISIETGRFIVKPLKQGQASIASISQKIYRVVTAPHCIWFTGIMLTKGRASRQQCHFPCHIVWMLLWWICSVLSSSSWFIWSMVKASWQETRLCWTQSACSVI